jgi:hypothetical protein
MRLHLQEIIVVKKSTQEGEPPRELWIVVWRKAEEPILQRSGIDAEEIVEPVYRYCWIRVLEGLVEPPEERLFTPVRNPKDRSSHEDRDNREEPELPPFSPLLDGAGIW